MNEDLPYFLEYAVNFISRSITTGLVLAIASTAALANPQKQSQFKELSTELKNLKALNDPNISKVYKLVHEATNDGIISEEEKANILKLIESNKQDIKNSKQKTAPR